MQDLSPSTGNFSEEGKFPFLTKEGKCREKMDPKFRLLGLTSGGEFEGVG